MLVFHKVTQAPYCQVASNIESHMKVNFAQVGLALVAAASVSSAMAAPITTWNYSVTSVFVPADTTFNAATGQGVNNSTKAVSTSEISWGRKNGKVGVDRSALQIKNSPNLGDGILETNGASNVANTYTHVNNNNLGTGSVSLHATTILATLKLTADGFDLPAQVAKYAINFYETPNSGVCPEYSVTKCSDIFVLDGPLTAQFGYQDYLYTVTFAANPDLMELKPSTCALTGAEAGCVGFITQEGRVTDVNFNLRIEAQYVPEPASLALIGLGLVGIGAFRRRKPV